MVSISWKSKDVTIFSAAKCSLPVMKSSNHFLDYSYSTHFIFTFYRIDIAGGAIADVTAEKKIHSLGDVKKSSETPATLTQFCHSLCRSQHSWYIVDPFIND